MDAVAALRRPDPDYESLYRQAIVANQERDEQLALLAHELRNPLNALSTSSEVLRRATPGSVPAVSAVNVIARQVRRLADLIDLRLPNKSLASGPEEHGDRPADTASDSGTDSAEKSRRGFDDPSITLADGSPGAVTLPR